MFCCYARHFEHYYICVINQLMNNFKLLKTMNIYKIALLLLAVIFCSCSVNRISTTRKTAVEKALISKACNDVIFNLKINSGNFKKVYIEWSESEIQKSSLICGDAICNETPYELIQDLMINKLLGSNFLIAKKKEDADIIVNPIIYFSDIDDDNSLLGIPSIPIPLPGVGTVNTPEISLFSINSQYGRSKFALNLIDAKEGKLIEHIAPKHSESYYKRVNLLFIFDFRLTNLGDPF